ncbi:MAG TPA: response regulator [Thermoanaerobaculia bacterium]|jgi:DNA-binding response OmpR family regulator
MSLDGRARVLIADADGGLRRGLDKRLLDADVVADSASNSHEALAKLNSSAYAVVILDLALPRIGAERIIEVIGEIPRRDRPVVIVLTAPGATRSLDIDVVQIVLRKPCDLSQLSEIVQSCVRSSHSVSVDLTALPDFTPAG